MQLGDIEAGKRSRIFKTSVETIFLSTPSTVVFPEEDQNFPILEESEFYVNGHTSDEVQKETPLKNILKRGQPVPLQRYPQVSRINCYQAIGATQHRGNAVSAAVRKSGVNEFSVTLKKLVYKRKEMKVIGPLSLNENTAKVPRICEMLKFNQDSIVLLCAKYFPGQLAH